MRGWPSTAAGSKAERSTKESWHRPILLLAAIQRIKINRPLIAIADHATSKPDDSYGHIPDFGDRLQRALMCRCT